MCGPLVFMIGQHRYRYYYFLGRLLSFSLAGMLAGLLGAITNVTLSYFHLSVLASFFFGGLMYAIAFSAWTGRQLPGTDSFLRFIQPINQHLSRLLLIDRAWPAFMFGFLTVALPCGQTLLVFTACALSGSPWIGLFNGFALALLTSPSLWLAMHAQALFKGLKNYYQHVLAICGMVVGTLAVCRGLAELNVINHWVLNAYYHIVVF
jgi:sulfite exporter TauE/SafE